MKKVLTLLAVLALTAPLFAVNTVTVTATNPAGTKDILLTFSDPNGTCKGLAVTLDPDASGTFGANAFVAGSVDPFFDVFLDYCYSNPGFTLPLVGAHPLAKVDSAGVPTLPLAAGDPISVCVGHLQGAAATNHQVAKLTLTVPTGTSQVVITADALRGNAADALGEMPVVIVGSPLTVPTAPAECLKSTATEYNSWLGSAYAGTPTLPWTRPDCWCFKRQCKGDATGVKNIYWVQQLDLNILKSAWNKSDNLLTGNLICADFNHTKNVYRVQQLDLNILKASWNKGDTLVLPCDLNGDGILEAADKYNFWTN